jgi:4a-hydroxytetrahydrobiopterin dehydratase
MSALAQQKCIPCSGGVPRMGAFEADQLLFELGDGWKVVDTHHLTRRFEFPDFKTALAFVDRVGAVAEEEGHHPDIHLSWGAAQIDIWTHKIDGLTRSDFILAAKASEQYGRP